VQMHSERVKGGYWRRAYHRPITWFRLLRKPERDSDQSGIKHFTYSGWSYHCYHEKSIMDYPFFYSSIH